MKRHDGQRAWWQDRRFWIDPGAHHSIVEGEALYNLLRQSPRRIKRRGKLPKSVWRQFMVRMPPHHDE